MNLKKGMIAGIAALAVIILLMSIYQPKTRTQLREEWFLVNEGAKIRYDYHRPDTKYFLPYSLQEISGLTMLDNKHVLAVQDEKGSVFEYDLSRQEITREVRFAHPNDFEGVEIVDGVVYVLESDGDLHYFSWPEEGDKVEAKKIETKIGHKNDAEGLGYDPVKKNLLIALKGDAEISKKDVHGKAVYKYDLEDKELKKKPWINITNGDLKDFFEKHHDWKYEKEKIKFAPSAIAYNPADELFYILASVGKLIVAVDREGELVSSYPLPGSIFLQPEGLCFSPNGNMYIASEGVDDKGYILEFRPL